MGTISKAAAKKMRDEVAELTQDAADLEDSRRDLVLENISFNEGYQYRVRGGEYMDDGDLPSGEAVETRNIIRPIVRAAVGATLKQQVKVEIASMSSDPKARARADNSEALCQSWINNQTFDFFENHQTVQFSKIVGLAWMKMCWDPDAGKAIDVGRTGFEDMPEGDFEEPEQDAFGYDVPEQVFEGEIITEFVPSTDLLLDPSIHSRKELRQPGKYVVHRKLMTTREAETKYPLDFFGDDTDGKFGMERNRSTAVDLAMGLDSQSRKTATRNELVEVCEFWENPCKKYPRGRTIIFSDELIIYIGPCLYQKPARIPFVPLVGDNVATKSLNSAGVVADLKSVQRSLNRAESKKREWMDKILNARVWLPRGSGVDPDELTDLEGQAVEYNPGMKPETDRPPEIPQSMFQLSADLEAAAKAISGYSDVSQGAVDSAISSGRQLAFQREAEESPRSADMTNYRIYLMECLSHMLMLSREFYQEGRLVAMLGEEGKWQYRAFLADDFDVESSLVMDVDSNKPSSPSQRMSEILELAAADLFNQENPNGKAALKLLGGDYARSQTWDADSAARAKAKRQILQAQMEPWKQLVTLPSDNHKIWLDTVDEYRQSLEFEEMPEVTQKLLNDAANLHETFSQAQDAALGMSQEMQGPSGPQPPGPAPDQGATAAPSPMDGGQQAPAPPVTMDQYIADPGADGGGNQLAPG